MDNAPSKAHWLLGRIGLSAKAFVYGMLGALMIHTRFTTFKDIKDKPEMLLLISEQFLGQLFLVILMLGLVSYAIFQGIEALRKLSLSRTKTYFKTLLHIGRGATYGALAWGTGEVLLDMADTQDRVVMVSHWIMQSPMGFYVLGAVGIATCLAGLSRFYAAFSKGYTKRFQFSEAHLPFRYIMHALAWLGLSTQGSVFFAMGYFLCKAAWMGNAAYTEGLEGVLEKFQQFSPSLLVGLGLGFISYGSFLLCEALFMKPVKDLDTSVSAD